MPATMLVRNLACTPTSKRRCQTTEFKLVQSALHTRCS
jgi:hypothetical protein